MDGVTTGTLRVYIVDDHEMVRDGIRGMLGSADGIEVCGEAGDRATARREILALRPDLALVDVRLPDGNGIELIRELRSRDPQLRCVVLTSLPDGEAFFHSVVAGAYGYLVKDVSAPELEAAVRAVAAGETLIRPETIDELRRREREVPPSDELLRELTGQEQRILWMVTDGLTNREIAVELKLAEKTVRNYVTNILAKVGVRNRTQLAVYVAVRRRAG
jgi:two-component system, NarL family, response regulator DevR